LRISIILVVLVVALAAYVRLAPTDPAVWHKVPRAAEPGNAATATSFLAVRRIVAPAPEVLRAIEQRALAAPRTTLLAGSVAEAMITFETRSLLWGFPDYTTVAIRGDLLAVYGRPRFGRSFLDVNRARVESWLETLGPLTAPL